MPALPSPDDQTIRARLISALSSYQELSSNRINWLQSDVFELDEVPFSPESLKVIVCNLILHHFDHQQPQQLAKLFAPADHLLLTEPLRARLPQALGYLAFPFINRVTRHDMQVSIRAGFLPGELDTYFSNRKVISSKATQRGSLRIHYS